MPDATKKIDVKQSAIWIIIVSLIVFCIIRCSGTDNQSGSAAEAWYIAMEFAKKDLKAPATADFPSQFADGVKITDNGGGKYTIQGYVDAENSFGAKIRQHFIVEVEKQPDSDKWSSGGVTWR